MVATIGPVDGAAVHVALRFYPEGVEVERWDGALWDGAGVTWEGVAPADDVSCAVEALAITTGRDQPLDRFRTSTATMTLDDPEGRYSPWRTAADPSEYATVRPGIGLEVWVVTDAGTYPRFTGVVDSITDVWPDPSPDLDARHQVVFQAHDRLGEVAAFDGFEQAPAGAHELTGARVNRILDTTTTSYPRQIDTGTVTVAATTLAKNALDEIGMTADTERGAFFCTGDGVLRFLDRNGLVADPNYTTVQAVFGEQPAEGELCYTDITLASDQAKVRNLVTISREGGTAVTVSDLTSRSMFGTRTYRRLDLVHDTDSESTTIANEQLAAFAYAANRVERLTVSPVIHPGDLDAFLELGVLHKIEVRRRTRGFQVVAQLQIQAISERIMPHTWDIEYSTFAATSVFNVGRWDRDKWDAGKWGY